MKKLKLNFSKILVWLKADPKRTILIGATTIIVLAGSVSAYLIFGRKKVDRIDASTTAQAVEQPTTKASPLTGIEVAIELADRPVLGVMIENSPDARPQSSLDQAGIVFETVAEGGITRFLALYQEAKPTLIGPVRSLRAYYLDWGITFDAAIAHVGGSADALQRIRSTYAQKDFDQFFNSSYFWRASDRYAPHNVYTSTEKMDALFKAKGINKSEFTPWQRKDEAPLGIPKATTIAINHSSYLYNTTFSYDQATNTYLRAQAGSPHVDRESGKQITVKNVLAIMTGTSLASDGQHMNILTTGSGPFKAFMDGDVIEGTWSKDATTSQFKFIKADGTELSFNRGSTWVGVVSTSSPATYTGPPPAQ